LTAFVDDLALTGGLTPLAQMPASTAKTDIVNG